MKTGVAALVVLAAVVGGCDSTPRDTPAPQVSAPVSATTPTGSVASTGTARIRPHQARMPDVPPRLMYLEGSRGVLASAAGRTRTGLGAEAYVPTRRGALFADGERAYALREGGDPVPIGPVGRQSVFFQVDPTLRYVLWSVAQARGRAERTLVYDVVAARLVLDRRLPWADRPSDRGSGHRSERLRVEAFGDPRVRLVQLPRQGIWTFGTRSGHVLVLPAGSVLDLRRGGGPTRADGVGVWSPGLRYRAVARRGRHPWRVTDVATGRDVTPEDLVGSTGPVPRDWIWLGNRTLGVFVTSGTWRHQTVTASRCLVGGRCHVAFQLRLGVHDGGLGASNEIG